MKRKNVFIVGLALMCANLISGCKKEETATPVAATTTTVAHIKGQSYGGGIVFYVDATGQHGLIVATTDQSTGIQWYNGTVITALVANTDTLVGKGQANTTAIINAQAAGSYAASICDQLVLNGYSDWFLPSKDELNLLYLQKEAGTVTCFASMVNNYCYWSSSECPKGGVWYQYLDGGQQYTNSQDITYYVRAIRAF